MTSDFSSVDRGVVATDAGLRHTTTHVHTFERVRELYAIRCGAEIEVGVAQVGQSKVFLSLTAEQAATFGERLIGLAKQLREGESDA